MKLSVKGKSGNTQRSTHFSIRGSKQHSPFILWGTFFESTSEIEDYTSDDSGGSLESSGRKQGGPGMTESSVSGSDQVRSSSRLRGLSLCLVINLRTRILHVYLLGDYGCNYPWTCVLSLVSLSLPRSIHLVPQGMRPDPGTVTFQTLSNPQDCFGLLRWCRVIGRWLSRRCSSTHWPWHYFNVTGPFSSLSTKGVSYFHPTST